MKIRPRYITPFAIFSMALFTSVAVLFAIGAAYAPFADFLNGTVCHAARVALSYLTSPLPFSLFEALLYLAPTLVTFAVVLGISTLGDKWRTVRFISGLLSVLLLFFSLYTLTLGISYRTSSLSKKLAIKEEQINAEVLYRTGTVLLDTLDHDLDEIDYAESGSSIMPYSFDRLSEKILEAYDGVEARFGFLKNFKSRAKPIYASEAMSHLELLGIYSPTGEANVNVDYPDYNLPFTVAHEFAHQRGIAREDEANFVAFLVCMQSDDPFIRYSGCLNCTSI